MATAVIPFGAKVGLFENFRKDMDELVARFMQSDGAESDRQVAGWVPRLNLCESETHYELSVDLPGIDPEHVTVELRYGDLWITGERKAEFEEQGKTWHRIERCYGQFRRVVRLGDDVAPDAVEARFKDGVLLISVPKSEQAKTKRIEVKR